MKKLLLGLSFIAALQGTAQIPAYYTPVDFTQMGAALRVDLADLIISTHTSPTTYSEVWDVLKTSDLDPTNSAVVLLMYGYNDGDGSVITDRTRDKNNNGGSVGQWNREHVFPKSLASPELGTTGAGADPHNLRASDVQANGNRSNRKFAAGSGNAGTVGTNWYPGDEWKGDAARIVMYMYLRYGSRCLPSSVTVGSSVDVDANMIELLLDWNAEDDVSTFEMNRNNAIYAAIGNRNPFIDNPHIATHIWGGPEATDTWGSLNVSSNDVLEEVVIYPNPVTHQTVNITNLIAAGISTISITTLQGKIVTTQTNLTGLDSINLNLNELANGVYLVQLTTTNGTATKKIIVQ